jgi:hypothetical protein
LTLHADTAIIRMARLARLLIPGHPHHVTQRGNGRARRLLRRKSLDRQLNLGVKAGGRIIQADLAAQL